MMLSIFSCLFKPFVYLLLSGICSSLLPIFNWVVCRFVIYLYKFFIFWICLLSNTCIAKIFQQSDLSFCFLFFYKFIYFIYFWLHWVFIAVCRLSLVAVSGGYSSSRCTGFSLWWLLLLRSRGSRHAGFSSCGAQA